MARAARQEGETVSVPASLRHLSAVVAALVAFVSLSPPVLAAQDDAGEEEGAMVRMAHLSPDTPRGDIYLDGAPVGSLRGVPYGAVSEYLPLPAGAKKVEVYTAGETPETSEPALEVEASLEDGEWYTLAAVGLLSDGSLAAKLYEDDRSPPAEGKAEVRVVHAAPDVGAATVSVAGGEELFALPGFSNASDYAEVEAGAYTFEVRPAGSDQVALEVPDVTLYGGEIRTLFVVGQAANGSLDVVPVLDRRGEGTPASTPPR